MFPFPIRHVDRGTKDVLVQQVKEADNILLLKAGVKNFQPTNLSVFTADGSSYSFAVNFQEKPLIWIYEIPAQIETSVQTYASGILDNPRTMKGLRDRKWEMSFAITGIYIKANVIYYQLRLDNNSPIDYDIDFLRFYIRDRKKGKRTASQENEVKPIYTAGNTTCVKAIDENMIVVALDKFTIPDAKYLAIEINERSGGRHLLLKVGNRKIIQAVPLPDLH
ncbi:MAG: conjugative transposon protein TraN [Sphingobacteriales bacterium 44-61]|nr:MAG: conjugative transposon protein TraN [Sphingobacteriales bacterium 44-61]